MFLRFVTSYRDPDSHRAQGPFVAAYALRDRGELDEHERAWFQEVVGWFDRHLKGPRGGVWRVRSQAERDLVIFWFKAGAHEHVQRMRDVCTMLGHHGVPTRLIRSASPGRIVYEDEHQVGAIPFRDGPV